MVSHLSGQFHLTSGLMLEPVTFQLTTIITGFACPDWKGSHLNVDASE